jgi:hypothetical protein
MCIVLYLIQVGERVSTINHKMYSRYKKNVAHCNWPTRGVHLYFARATFTLASATDEKHQERRGLLKLAGERAALPT